MPETGNQQDYTMRAGSQRSSLPLMRRFNEHSERLLDSALGKDPTRSRTTIDGGNAGARDYYREIELEDLHTRQSANRVALNMQDQHRYAHGRVSAKRTLDDAVRVGSRVASDRSGARGDPCLSPRSLPHVAPGSARGALPPSSARADRVSSRCIPKTLSPSRTPSTDACALGPRRGPTARLSRRAS